MKNNINVNLKLITLSFTILLSAGILTAYLTKSAIIEKQADNDILNGGITYSDIRLKNVTGDNASGLKEIERIKVKNYTMKYDKTKEPQVGVIAQELQKVFPNSVIEGKDGYLRIKRDEIFYACVNSLKELNSIIQNIFVKITGLDKKIKFLDENIKIKEEKIKILENDKKNDEEELLNLEKQNILFEKRLSTLEKSKKQ